MASLAGTVVSHRYEILGVIAEGGQALICRARDRTSGRDVAVKMLTSATAQNREFVQRLAREQEAMIALAGTCAVAVLDLCRAPSGAPCLVMELLDGKDLEQHLEELEDRRELMSIDRVYDIFDPIVETLERAHDAGILHRDLKPANLYLLSNEAGGGVRLLDFGLSRMKTATPLTAMGTILGSPSYIAPEVWSGQTDVLDRRVDVYSLAVILFRVLAGRLPFVAASLHDKFVQTTTAPRPSLVALRPELPNDVDDWVQRALAIEPARRFSTAHDMWAGLLSAIRFSPRPRAHRPMAESLVDAWRAAAGSFRRVMAGGIPTPMPPPMGESRLETSGEWIADEEILDLEEPQQDLNLDDIFKESPPSQPRPEEPASQPSPRNRPEEKTESAQVRKRDKAKVRGRKRRGRSAKANAGGATSKRGKASG